MALPTAEQIEICWGERRVTAELTRTVRRALRIDVRPTGEVTVFAPVGEGIEEIRTRAHRKGAWIFAQIDTIAQRPKVTPERRYISGETHLLLGRQYRLSVEESGDPHVRIDSGRMVMAARAPEDQPHCRRLLQAFYRLRAREVLRQRFDIVLEPFVRRGLRRPSLVIRPMAKRWGSYTPSGRVVLNIDLVRASPRLIDYVICHELSHAFYPDHGDGWRALLETVMPDWEERKEALEAALR
ncbi:SprT family zinc-dependent metalloprotease [Kaistia dalseonensis]|uniref:Metal-dependent hydrolase n=1 Tax=Kaistia dalseonensis TaxID=410840 RepID=A0ABU0H2G2_9HYPH|nr:SprT family zinc-dependent metalloprotease [Kaistia dalseonensis]MCX5493921.1 SprT family zinc-dependent metalloprotease [Kaistia dalseonensis]MDQ0436491.1 putative metal-dependent hydrolase [Kaistia dalseonensis]